MIKISIQASVLAFSLSLASLLQAAEFDAAAKYTKTCAVCHSSGVAGAPKKGDAAAWEKRLAGGMDAMVTSVKKGKGAMPPNGMCADCTDDQFKALINYMAVK